MSKFFEIKVPDVVN